MYITTQIKKDIPSQLPVLYLTGHQELQIKYITIAAKLIFQKLILESLLLEIFGGTVCFVGGLLVENSSDILKILKHIEDMFHPDVGIIRCCIF